MKLRDWITAAALGMLLGTAYAYMQQSDEAAAQRDRAAWTGKVDR